MKSLEVCRDWVYDKKYLDIAEKALKQTKRELETYPLYTASLARAMLMLENMKMLHTDKETALELVGHLEALGMAFVTFVLDSDDTITICDKSNCQANYKSVQELLGMLK